MELFTDLKPTEQELRQLRNLIYERSGIVLNEKKRALIVGRLQRDIRARGFSSFQEYYQSILSDSSGRMLSELIDRISTNHTYFWRESGHFEYLQNVVLPEVTARLMRQNSNDLRLWCAAASTGEEPYTILMMIKEYLGPSASHWYHDILATDISSHALEKARKGIYSKKSIEKLPPHLRKYFKPIDPKRVQVREDLRKGVLYRRLNLIDEAFPFKGKFQIIFCRNVMIYFDQQTRLDLLKKFYNVMEPDGYLFIGITESLGRNNPYFQYVRPSVYKRISR